MPVDAILVTADNFIRAESDMYFSHSVQEGGFGKFHHHREPMDIDHQSVIRANRDTLYSSAVFDLDAGAVTILGRYGEIDTGALPERSVVAAGKGQVQNIRQAKQLNLMRSGLAALTRIL